MGTLAVIAPLAPILGLLAGIISAFLAKSELKPGKYYFQLMQHAMIGVIAGSLAWQFGQITAIPIGMLVFLVLWKTKFTHPVELIPILAVPATLSSIAQIPIFLYLIPTGTLHNTELKELTVVSVVYAVLVTIASLPF